MQTITFTEFRKNASAVISAVEGGEIIRILRHGKPVADVVPAKNERNAQPSWKTPGLKLSIPGSSLSRIIIEERKSS